MLLKVGEMLEKEIRNMEDEINYYRSISFKIGDPK